MDETGRWLGSFTARSIKAALYIWPATARKGSLSVAAILPWYGIANQVLHASQLCRGEGPLADSACDHQIIQQLSPSGEHASGSLPNHDQTAPNHVHACTPLPSCWTGLDLAEKEESTSACVETSAFF
jgi:hypothetical protein